MLFGTKTVGALAFNFVSRWRYIRTFYVVNILSVPVKSTLVAQIICIVLKMLGNKELRKRFISKE